MDLSLGIFFFVVVLMSVVIHEVAHGLAAKELGDRTAEEAGRLTLNPIKHIDPFGSIILPLVLHAVGAPVLGWAKPVPYNPYNLYKDYKYGPLKVALAGPASNILLLLIFGLAARFGLYFLPATMVVFLSLIALINAQLAFFNLVPIPPLDGSKILTVIFPRFSLAIQRMGVAGIFLVLIFIYLFSGLIATISQTVFAAIAGTKVSMLLVSF